MRYCFGLDNPTLTHPYGDKIHFDISLQYVRLRPPDGSQHSPKIHLYMEIMCMNKLSLIETLRTETRLTNPEAAAVVKIFFDEMADALGKGDRVEIRGFCSFFVKKYKAYTGRNPKTGKKVKIKPKKLPFFKCGVELKRRVDY
jgi:integration host factor subunit beta